MDFSAVVKQIEQFIFELLMWVIFYPYTLVRVVFRPTRMLGYVSREIVADPDTAFASAIRPPLFLFLCIAVGSVIAPIGAEQARILEQNEVGRFLTASWINLLAFRTLGFSVFALTGALIFDLITPGEVTRHSLTLPFYQQCYVCGPFALGLSPALVRLDTGQEILLLVLLALEIWLLVVQTLFFRRLVVTGWFRSFLLALAVLVIGNAGLVAIPLVAAAVMP
jgi:hypothetical protein